MKGYKSLIISFSIGLFFSAQILGQGPAISLELEKLKEVRKSLNPNDGNAAFDTQFKDLEADLAANRLYSSLHKLQTLWLGVVSASYNEKKTLVVQDKLPLLEIEWKKVGEDLSAKEKRFSPVVINQLPALARAIIQASRFRSHPYYTSSILYGKNTNPNQGLYYMGFAQANLDLALFNQSLRFQSKKTSLKFSPLEKELNQLEREIIESYRISPPEEQTRYNALNASLKLAQELNERNWFEGAMLKYLDTILAFGMLKKIEVNSNEISAVKPTIEGQKAVLTKDKFDHSIGITFLELAQNYLANSQGNEANSKRVKVILDEVLPKYLSYISNLKNRGSK